MSELTTLQILMLEEEIKEIGKGIMALHSQYKVALTEAIDDFISDDNDLGFMFDEAKKRFMAAKRGLALTNKLQDPMQRKEHKSRVLSNLNKLRAIFNRLQKDVEATIQAAQQGSQGRDLFQPTSPSGIKSEFGQASHPPSYRNYSGNRPVQRDRQQTVPAM